MAQLAGEVLEVQVLDLQVALQVWPNAQLLGEQRQGYGSRCIGEYENAEDSIPQPHRLMRPANRMPGDMNLERRIVVHCSDTCAAGGDL